MELLTRDQIIDIAAKLKSCAYATEQEADLALAALKNGVFDPNISDYIFRDDLTPEETADRALSYQPIVL